MAAYLIRRLWQMVPTLFGVILLVFLLFKGFGGDPAEILGGLNATTGQVASIRKQLGLDEPLWVQFGIFLKQFVTFNWATDGRPTRRSAISSRLGFRPR